MHVRRSAAGLEVLAPAKINLSLEVIHKRDDGFHEIETLMVPIALWDSVFFDPSEAGELSDRIQASSDTGEVVLRSTRVTTQGLVRQDPLPEGDDNLVVRAVRLLRKRAGVSYGALVRLVKRIPIAAGLAGGSSDAAAALVAANVGWGLGYSRERLSPLAAELGSDVPFFLHEGPALCRGRGERVERVAGLPPLHLVVVRPPVGLSTRDVYQACVPARKPGCVERLLDALRTGDLPSAGRSMFNGLQEAAETLSPWIARLRSEFARLDFLGHQMSGSGTCYYGLCWNARHAGRLRAQLRGRGVGEVYQVRGCP